MTAQRSAKAAARGFKVLPEGDARGAGRKEPVVYVPLELAANVTDSKPAQVQVRGGCEWIDNGVASGGAAVASAYWILCSYIAVV